MDVHVDPALRWEGIVAVERRRAGRWMAFVGAVLPVLALVLFSGWFFRSYVMPPTIVIPAPMTLASMPPEPALPTSGTDGRSLPAEAAAEPVQHETPAETANTFARPHPLPMLQSLALAPPVAPFGYAPTTYAAPQSDAGRNPVLADLGGPSVPIAGPVPLPLPRPRASVARVPGPVPLPPVRPPQ